MEFVNTAKKNKKRCHDCEEEIKIEGKEIKNGVLLKYDNDDDQTIEVFKCNQCYQKNPGLTNFRKCEVYSRVVGYIRPVQQWHIGKKQEFKERQEFKAAKIQI